MADDKQTVKIDDNEYNVGDLSEDARQQIANLRVADQEIERLESQLALARTARNAYARALAEQLPNKEA